LGNSIKKNGKAAAKSQKPNKLTH